MAVLGNPSAYLQRLLVRFTTVDPEIFTLDVVDTYLAQLAAPDRVHALTEDYRCSAPGGVDLAHDAEDCKVGVGPLSGSSWCSGAELASLLSLAIFRIGFYRVPLDISVQRWTWQPPYL